MLDAGAGAGTGGESTTAAVVTIPSVALSVRRMRLRRLEDLVSSLFDDSQGDEAEEAAPVLCGLSGSRLDFGDMAMEVRRISARMQVLLFRTVVAFVLLAGGARLVIHVLVVQLSCLFVVPRVPGAQVFTVNNRLEVSNDTSLEARATLTGRAAQGGRAWAAEAR